MFTLKKIFTNEKSRQGRYFSLFIQSLIIISIISFSVETIPHLSPSLSKFLNYLELIIVLIFSIEYLLRIYFAETRVKYIFSFYGIIDFLAILPFYLTIGIDLRSLRAFRILRLVRLLKLVRYSKALDRYVDAIKGIKEELTVFFFLTILLLFITSVGIYYFENDAQPEAFQSIFHCMWWSIATLSTVGYGDVYPITLGGKVFTFFIVMIGIGIIAVPSGLFASALTNSVKNKSFKKEGEK